MMRLDRDGTAEPKTELPVTTWECDCGGEAITVDSFGYTDQNCGHCGKPMHRVVKVPPGTRIQAEGEPLPYGMRMIPPEEMAPSRAVTTESGKKTP